MAEMRKITKILKCLSYIKFEVSLEKLAVRGVGERSERGNLGLKRLRYFNQPPAD